MYPCFQGNISDVPLLFPLIRPVKWYIMFCVLKRHWNTRESKWRQWSVVIQNAAC